jgi:hypothetical protein
MMPLQTATNSTTGERVVLVGDQWQPIMQSATNKEGVKAYLVGDKWLTDDAPAAQTSVAPSETSAPRKQRGFLETIGAPIEAVSQGVISGGGNVVLGGQRLLGKGLSALGAKDTGTFLQEDAARRLAESQATVAPFKKEFPVLTGVGELGGEIVGTLPVGGVLAAPLKAIPAAAPLAQSIRTGGFSTGRAVQNAPLAARAANLGTRAAGGATLGGATAAILHPAEVEPNAQVGGARAVAAPMPLRSAIR